MNEEYPISSHPFPLHLKNKVLLLLIAKYVLGSIYTCMVDVLPLYAMYSIPSDVIGLMQKTVMHTTLYELFSQVILTLLNNLIS